MEEASPNASKASIPRLSKLPVRAAGIRAAPSIDGLRSQVQKTSLTIPKLRTTPSRDRLVSPRSSTTIRDRDTSNPTVVRAPTRTSSAKSSLPTQRDSETQDVPSKTPARPQDDVRDPVRQEGNSGDTEEFEIVSQHDTKERKPRLSLSERTKETLAQLPASPALKRRQSSYYNNGSPSRLDQSYNGSVSRPITSYTDTEMPPPMRSASFKSPTSEESPDPPSLNRTASWKPPPALTSPMPRQSLLKTPLRVKSFSNLPKSSASKGSYFADGEVSPSPVKHSFLTAGSKTTTSRTLKPRASMGSILKKPTSQSLESPDDSKKISPTFSDTSEFSAVSTVSKVSSISSVGKTDKVVTPSKSSSALREQIAQAKAEKRALMSKQASSSEAFSQRPIMPTDTFDFGLEQDPFNQAFQPEGNNGLLKKRIDSARTDGKLNIAAMGLKEIPKEVMSMYNLENIDSGSWAESVDLTRFIAADNELSFLGDDIFPDIDPRAMADDDDSNGNQFGGLETLDLHGNILTLLPLGLRRLELLTKLNLSNNKLGNECFEVISQIQGLRELKLAGNCLSGELPEAIAQLISLEVIDVHGNALTNLPERFSELDRLRRLDLSENSFTTSPFKLLRDLPIVDLSISKNKLSGVLIDFEDFEHSHLQILDIAVNSLTSFSAGSVKLPVLHQLNCSANRLKGLPDLTTWVSLLTLSANDNGLTNIPVGFVELPKVKNVDLSGNDIVSLDDGIAMMDSLDMLRIGGNPLREKKFSAMNTQDLKRALKARITVEEPSVEQLLVVADVDSAHEPSVETESFEEQSAHASEQSVDSDVTSRSISPRILSKAEWPVKAGGVLDRSDTKSFSLNPVAMAQAASGNEIKAVELHHNLFKEIPHSLEFVAHTLTHLSMAHNELNSDSFLKEDLELPNLKELNLSSNTLNTLGPLISHLKAPNLTHLDISFNRLTSLPSLKIHFPALTHLIASNNTIRELSPEAVKGLRVLDCSSNELNSLNARIGLLGGEGGLQRLEVGGNRFRVPKYTVLEKGTEATLAWLRDRIPAGELDAAQKEAGGEAQGL